MAAALGTSSLKINQRLPDANVIILEKDKATGLAARKMVPLNSLYDRTKPCVVFTFPAAFSPTCTGKHLPGIREYLDDFRKFECQVICVTTDNIHALENWQKSGPGLTMASDCNLEFGKATGLLNKENADPTLPPALKRSSIVVLENVVGVSVEASGKNCDISSGEKAAQLIALTIKSSSIANGAMAALAKK